MSAECCVCGLALPLDRSPVVLACGHTSCSTCREDFPRRSETRCPQCCKKIRLDTADNCDGAGVIKEHAITPWCLECDAAPTPSCLRDHSFCNVARLVHEAAKYADALHDEADVELQRAAQVVETLRTWTNAAASREDLLAVRAQAACAVRIRAVLQQAVEQMYEEVRRCQPGCEGDAPEGTVKMEPEEPQDARDEVRSCNVLEAGVQNDAPGPVVISVGSVKQELDEQHERVDDSVHLNDHTYCARVNEMPIHGVDINSDVSLHGFSLRGTHINNAASPEITSGVGNVEASVISTGPPCVPQTSLYGAIEDCASHLEISHEGVDTNVMLQDVHSLENVVGLHKIPHLNDSINVGISGPNQVLKSGSYMNMASVRVRETLHQGADRNIGDAGTNESPAVDSFAGNREVPEISDPGFDECNTKPPDELCSDQSQSGTVCDFSVEIPGTGLWAETEDSAESGIEETQDGRCWIESLPDELLRAVLAYVPTTQLLPLRLLGRRWSKLVLAKAVWRHRRLCIPAGLDQSRDTARLAAILRLAPALDRLVLKMAHPPLRGLAGIEALADGRCKIRSLHLTFVASTVSNKVIKRALGSRCYSLQALSITITRCCSTSDLFPVLSCIDRLKGLKTLKLNFGSACPSFHFKGLRLENLILVNSANCPNRMGAGTWRSIIMSSKDTLREVKLDRCAPSWQTLQQCTKLDTLSLASCTGLVEALPRLPALQWVRIGNLFRPSALSWLRWTQSAVCLSVKTHVNVAVDTVDEFSDLLDLAGVLGAVHSLAVRPSAPLRVPAALVARLLDALPTVERLVLDFATDHEAVLRGWSAATVPALDELSVRVEDASERAFVLRELNIMRPSLELCFI